MLWKACHHQDPSAQCLSSRDVSQQCRACKACAAGTTKALRGHKAEITAVTSVCSANRCLAVTGGADSVVRLWHASASSGDFGVAAAIYRGMGKAISDVCGSKELGADWRLWNETLVSCGAGRSMIWDVVKGSCISSMKSKYGAMEVVRRSRNDGIGASRSGPCVWLRHSDGAFLLDVRVPKQVACVSEISSRHHGGNSRKASVWGTQLALPTLYGVLPHNLALKAKTIFASHFVLGGA
jgi:WD40 repeat protein